MRLALCSLLLLFLVASVPATGQSHAPGPAPVYRITGVVVSSVDEAPVAHAHLSATLSLSGRAWRGDISPQANGVDADAQGRFSLTLPSPGRWHLTAESPGFVTRSYEQHDQYSCAVVVAAETPAVDLHFRLPPEAGITGTVFDEAGEAVRNARVSLQKRGSNPLGQQSGLFQNSMNAQTDDRGVYEFANLAAGDYRVLVDAKPWYALSGQSQGVVSSNGAAPSDPTLDVTYPLTWFPGVSDANQAETISLRPAEILRADFHLVPIPSSHLELSTNTRPVGNRPVPIFPVLERIDTGGGVSFAQTSMRTTSPGQMDIGGLAPGLYRIRVPGEDGSQSRIIQVGSGASSTVDVATAAAQLSEVTVQIDAQGEEEGQRRVGVELRNTNTGARFTSFDGGAVILDRGDFNRRSGRGGPQAPPHLQIPAGRYEISLMGRNEVYLVGTSVKGGEVKGRFLTVREGADVSLVLHTASGYASMAGMVTTNGKKLQAAIVLLVPAGLDDPASFATILKDESNTDGSFDLDHIVPGPYLLIAVDRGWEINWNDPATLQRYLTQAIPLEIHANARLKQNIEAQSS